MARRKRSKRFGELPHRKWYKGKSGGDTNWRTMKATVKVARIGDTGSAKTAPYRAIVCVGGTKKHGGFYPRLAAHRCGEAKGRTPTKAIRGAFRDLGKSFK